MLYVRTADLTARARIRDAAIECFAEQGFGASVRDIASRADVSPGLITHHFGSKNALRAECDSEVIHRYRQTKQQGVDAPDEQLLSVLAQPGMSATLLVYILRVIHAGGPSAAAFLDRLIDDMRPVMRHAVETGLVKPSVDEEARLREVVHMSLGGMLVRFLTSAQTTPAEFVASLHDPRRDEVLPLLELFTEGMLADRGLLDSYLAYREESAS